MSRRGPMMPRLDLAAVFPAALFAFDTGVFVVPAIVDRVPASQSVKAGAAARTADRGSIAIEVADLDMASSRVSWIALIRARSLANPITSLTALAMSPPCRSTQRSGRSNGGSGVSSRTTGMTRSESSSRPRWIPASSSARTQFELLALSDHSRITQSTRSSASLILPGSSRRRATPNHRTRHSPRQAVAELRDHARSPYRHGCEKETHPRCDPRSVWSRRSLASM